jgi:hypothetical protein
MKYIYFLYVSVSSICSEDAFYWSTSGSLSQEFKHAPNRDLKTTELTQSQANEHSAHQYCIILIQYFNSSMIQENYLGTIDATVYNSIV